MGDWTFLGAETMLDNLVHVAHNVRIGRRASLTACVELSGSVTVGDGVWLAPGVTVNHLVTIGNHSFIGTGSVVVRDIPPYSLAYGSPCRVAGLVCECRQKITFVEGAAVCAYCGRRYVETAQGIKRA
jgi:UDP-3-O-[3-hydroxymyristoyl] glucosamine N-acyltransferase